MQWTHEGGPWPRFHTHPGDAKKDSDARGRRVDTPHASSGCQSSFNAMEGVGGPGLGGEG